MLCPPDFMSWCERSGEQVGVRAKTFNNHKVS